MAAQHDFDLIVEGVEAQKTPGSALNKTVAALSLCGYRKAPSMSSVYHQEYGKLFIYEFKATPFGDLVLTVGGSIEPSLEKVADLPIASGVPGRFAVAATEHPLSASSQAAIARGQKHADRWASRFESPPAVRGARPAKVSHAPVHVVHEAPAPEVFAEVVEATAPGYPAVKYGRGRPQSFGPHLPKGYEPSYGETAAEEVFEQYGPSWQGESDPVMQAYEAPRAAAKARAPRPVKAAPAPAAAGGGDDTAFLAAMQSLIQNM